MAQPYFTWKNIDCRSMGIYLTGHAPIVRPEERVNHIQIPGMSGDLTQTEGENIFNSYIQTVTIHVKGGYRVREVYDWLRGDDFVTFSGEPDRRQPARIIGAVTLNRHSRNIDTWVGEVQFYCQPLKERLNPQPVLVSSSGSIIKNNGDVTAFPVITATCTAGSTVVIAAGGKQITVTMTGLSDTGCIIDCGAKIVTNTAKTQNFMNLCIGDFPELPQGNVEITGSGWTGLAIDKRERFL